jgi:nitroreductase
VDTLLAISSKRDTRSYADRPVPAEVENRILDAGRVAGSAMNRQSWRFVVVADDPLRERVAATVYAPSNVLGAALVVAIVGTAPPFDIGRCAQNMMLAAWNDGVASCPNGLKEPDAAREALALAGDDRVAIVLSFGYPARGGAPERRSPQEWSARADRKPLAELVERR